ncbi:N-acetylmuramic acid 6-phosphate etherase [Paucihalobacter ruber]|uniref:N-acetylmuramic acid 6-phosphate etherase n=1 Tax=Paucihalobacter ruber TaxID=2567861 RepID=A0A506PEJ2_9FLAO|nr:N-acetylmuramic acid 6-phosphate etherase [Paucihalobacter ruber]TPV32256.1 N-acetylmuramic acid 6-phosphate etherase [Paucihalobacter ruber]
MQFKKITESDSHYSDIEHMSTEQILTSINKEDQTVATSVQKVIPQIQSLVDIIADKMQQGGRLFYIGAGTSGRLGILDASECPPTFGVPHHMVIGLIAGGDNAIRKAVEFAEDSLTQGWVDLKAMDISKNDVVIGIAASGTTPYVLGALEQCNQHDITTGCITCNAGSPLSVLAKSPIEVVVGPEFITGSSRMKAGTAQKMILNMISTSVMIKLNRIKGNKMVDMQLSNNKLVERGTKMIMDELKLSQPEAEALLLKHNNVRAAITSYQNDTTQNR